MGGVQLGPDILLAIFNFSFSNPAVLPVKVPVKEPENCMAAVKRLNRVSSGIPIIDPTERVSLMGIVVQLEAAGYSLVNAWRQERNLIRGGKERRIWVARYEFGWCDPNRVLEIVESPEKYEAILTELRHNLCLKALWRARVFYNPYFEKGVVVDNKSTVSVDLDSRNVDRNVFPEHALSVVDRTELCLVDLPNGEEERGRGGA